MTETRSGRILIADDNATNQLFLGMRLKKLGHEVQVVATGRQAIEAISQTTFDLILMDCQMPEIDGFEATRLIRESEPNPKQKIPIVGLSVDASPTVRQKCLDAGMNDLLTKPVDEKRFLDVLRRWLLEN